MWPFQRKAKVGIEEFCRDFYDRVIYHTLVGVYWDTILENLASDNLIDLLKVDVPRFHKEMTALYFEVFALAWAHAHRSRGDYLLPQLAFTKDYLSTKGEIETWRAMAQYRGAVSQSAAAIATGERSYRARATYLNGLRLDFGTTWLDRGIDDEIVALAAGHLDTAGSWRKGVTRELLVETLVSRMKWQLGAQGRFRLGAVIFGLYEGARKSINSVNVQP